MTTHSYTGNWPAAALQCLLARYQWGADAGWCLASQEEHEAFSPEAFQVLRSAVDEHALLRRGNELDMDNFGLSYGWAIQFNAEGKVPSLAMSIPTSSHVSRT